jgi:magnesium-protoporphyrin IX monomethyl ester (oxidative) cyclase
MQTLKKIPYHFYGEKMRKRKIERILLVFPSMTTLLEQSRKTAIFPAGLGSLAAVLEKEYDVRIVDSSMEGYSNEVLQDNGLTCYGLSDDDYREIYKEFKPDIVGISCLFSSLHSQMVRAARLAKEVDPGVITVVGGPHPSALPGLILKDSAIDFCVLGEGEIPFAELLQYLRSGKDPSGVEGVAGKKGDNIYINHHIRRIADLDTLPFQAWHLLDMERYFNIDSIQGLRMDGKSKKSLRLIQVSTSRGCPFSCTYCGKNAVWGKNIHFMGVSRIMEMIEMLLDKYQVERLAFQDDNLTVNRKRAMELFKKMAKRNWPVTWEAHNGLAYVTLDEEMIDLMAESGCISFTLAVESGSKEVLKKVCKKVDLDRVVELAEHARSIGLDVRAFYIVGFPGETREQIEATRAHMRRMPASVSAMAIYTPLPGSPLYGDLENQGILNSDTMDFEKLTFGAYDVQLSEVPVSELQRIRKIDWLMKVFADEEGNLKEDLPMIPETIFEELYNGLQLYPDAAEIGKMYEQAKARFQRYDAA